MKRLRRQTLLKTMMSKNFASISVGFNSLLINRQMQNSNGISHQ